MSDSTIQDLITNVRTFVAPLFRISESIALLDMFAAFSYLVITSDATFVKPELTPDTLAIKSGRHPLIERIQKTARYIPNDVYATKTSRFQIITGCNMSGKSTYIRSIALLTVIAQIGCFIPATYASFPLVHQIFARCSTTSVESDNDVGANVSTFSAEMRETAFILSNISPHSLVLIDELGRGTSTTDGLAIAIAIAEALVSSGAMVWFVTHFRALPRILAERAGVVNLHLAVDISPDRMRMLYKICDGPSEDQYYGLALAKLLDFPPGVIEFAEHVSRALHSKQNDHRKDKLTIAVARRRKLLLSLKEQLSQARNGKMKGKELLQWLKSLQDEFTLRMVGIEADAKAASEANEENKKEFDELELPQDVLEPEAQSARPLLSPDEQVQDGLGDNAAPPQPVPPQRDLLIQHFQDPGSYGRRSTSRVLETPLKPPIQRSTHFPKKDDDDPFQAAFLNMIADDQDQQEQIKQNTETTTQIEHTGQHDDEDEDEERHAHKIQYIKTERPTRHSDMTSTYFGAGDNHGHRHDSSYSYVAGNGNSIHSPIHIKE